MTCDTYGMSECSSNDGFKALAAGIIMRAIEDYKMLESAGVIVNGKFDDRFYQPSSWFTRADQRSVDRQTFEDAHSLLRFFHLESFDSMARFAGVDPDAVRYKMGIK